LANVLGIAEPVEGSSRLPAFSGAEEISRRLWDKWEEDEGKSRHKGGYESQIIPGQITSNDVPGIGLFVIKLTCSVAPGAECRRGLREKYAGNHHDLK